MSKEQAFYSAEEISDRLSISTLVFWCYRPIGEQALRECARHGIRKIELLESPEQFDMADAGSMKLIGETCRSCGVELRAFHAHMTHFAEVETEADRIARVDQCRRQIDTMLDLGGAIWGSHANVAEAMVARSYEELARHVEGTPAVITVENSTGEQRWVEDRMAFLDKMDHPQVGMLLDSGPVRNSAGENPMTLPGGPTRVM
jgi:sugar phosphate isomerase/epimerase